MIQPSEQSPPCRLLFLSLSLITFASITAGTLTWIGQVRESYQRVSEASTEVARLSALTHQLPLVQHQLIDFDHQLRTSRYLLSATSPGQASAELLAQLKRGLSRRASLIDVTFLPSQSRANILRVGIRAHVRGDEHALLSVLYRNEQAHPLLHIENLHVRTLDSDRQESPRPTGAPLDIHFDLIGYMLQQ